MIRANDKGNIIATVLPVAQLPEHEQAEMERRIAASYNVLLSLPLSELERFSAEPDPIYALARWLETRKIRH